MFRPEFTLEHEKTLSQAGTPCVPVVAASPAAPPAMVACADEADFRSSAVDSVPGYSRHRLGSRSFFLNDDDALADGAGCGLGNAAASECSVCDGGLLDHEPDHDRTGLVLPIRDW